MAQRMRAADRQAAHWRPVRLARAAAAAIAGLLALTAAGGSALAAGVGKAQIAERLSADGYPVQDVRPDMIAVTAGEQTVFVALDGPDADISYVAYLDGVDLGLGGHAFLSRFNSEVKFGRAYIDRDGDVAIQMDRNASGGVTIENVESDFDVFLLLIAKFLSEYRAEGSV